MIVTSSIVSPLLLWCCNICFAITLVVALVSANWSALTQHNERLHLIIGSSLALVTLWLMTFSLGEHLWLHFLGTSFLTLMLGFSFAIISASMATIFLVILGKLDLLSVGIHGIVSITIPVLVIRYWLAWISKKRFQNVFVYTLGVGFFGTFISTIAALLAGITLFWLIQIPSEDLLISGNEWPVVVLLLFPEAFINGMLTSALTLYAPEWMKTYDDSFYLKK